MPTPQELEKKFWDALESDRTVMLGIEGLDNGHARPMTAMVEDKHAPIWFFTAKDTALVRDLDRGGVATANFSAKDHDLFASVQGHLVLDNDRAVIDRLWNPFIAAWFEGGKDDPNLALLRFDAQHAEIWENASSLLSGVKLLLGVDPKKSYRDKVAQVDLH